MAKVITCPQCHDTLVIDQARCGMVLHAVLKRTGRPVNPHTSPAQVELLLRRNKIYGCGARWELPRLAEGT